MGMNKKKHIFIRISKISIPDNLSCSITGNMMGADKQGHSQGDHKLLSRLKGQSLHSGALDDWTTCVHCINEDPCSQIRWKPSTISSTDHDHDAFNYWSLHHYKTAR